MCMHPDPHPNPSPNPKPNSNPNPNPNPNQPLPEERTGGWVPPPCTPAPSAQQGGAATQLAILSMLSRAVPYTEGAAACSQRSGSVGAFGSGASEPLAGAHLGSAQGAATDGGAQPPRSGSTDVLSHGGPEAPSSGATEPLSDSGAQPPSSGSTEPLSASSAAQAPGSGATEPLTAGSAAAVATGGLLSPEGASPPDSDLSAQIAVQLRKDEIRAAQGRASQAAQDRPTPS